jgi:hypothetical protein
MSLALATTAFASTGWDPFKGGGPVGGPRSPRPPRRRQSPPADPATVRTTFRSVESVAGHLARLSTSHSANDLPLRRQAVAAQSPYSSQARASLASSWSVQDGRPWHLRASDASRTHPGNGGKERSSALSTHVGSESAATQMTPGCRSRRISSQTLMIPSLASRGIKPRDYAARMSTLGSSVTVSASRSLSRRVDLRTERG